MLEDLLLLLRSPAVSHPFYREPYIIQLRETGTYRPDNQDTLLVHTSARALFWPEQGFIKAVTNDYSYLILPAPSLSQVLSSINNILDASL